MSAATADDYYETIESKLATTEFLPRALFERFNIEVLATTDSPLDSLADHAGDSGFGMEGEIVPTFRPDSVVDPEFAAFDENRGAGATDGRRHLDLARLSARAGERAAQFFKTMGATATDHGHLTAQTADLREADAERLFGTVLAGRRMRRGTGAVPGADADRDGAHEPGGWAGDADPSRLGAQPQRAGLRALRPRHGRGHSPARPSYVEALRPLLERFGNEAGLTIILFTLDETAYSRELAPLAGHYPCLKLGPPWWFFDSPEGMRRFREQVTETAGFYNTVGFNDDTRAFLSIPARHDVAREWTRVPGAAGRRAPLDEDEAVELARELTVGW